VRLSSCNTEQLTSVVRSVRRFKVEFSEGNAVPVEHPTAESKYRLVSGNEAERIVELYGSGLNAVEVGERVGRPSRTVTDVLRRAGVEIRQRTKLEEISEEEAARLYGSGLSQREVGRRLGVSEGSVRKLLERAGVQLRKPSKGLPEEKVLQLAAEYNAGASILTLAATHQLSKNTISTALHRAGIEIRKVGRPRK